jgi:hypothetical protein
VLTDDERGALAEGRKIELEAATIGGKDLHHCLISIHRIQYLITLTMFHKLLRPRVPLFSPLSCHSNVRTMATIRSSLSHEERTAQEPREARLEPVTVSRIDTVNDTIRLIRLSAMKPGHTLKVLISYPFGASHHFVARNTKSDNIHQSKVSSRPMARRLYPLPPKSRWFHHNLYAFRPRNPHL